MTKANILVIDDEEIVRISCQRTLVPAGYQVKMAKNGLEGIQMLENESFDIVLSDLKMPDMDGIEVLSIIKRKWPEIQVIIVTGYQTVDTAVKSIKLGAYDYIEKPFTPGALLNAVVQAIESKKK